MKTSKYYHDVVKMLPEALAEAQFSDTKCLILGEACMQVMGILKEYDKLRSIYVAKLNAELKKEMETKQLVTSCSEKVEEKK